MHYSQNEKMEIIRLVEQSDLGVIRTLRQLKVNKTTNGIMATNSMDMMDWLEGLVIGKKFGIRST